MKTDMCGRGLKVPMWRENVISSVILLQVCQVLAGM